MSTRVSLSHLLNQWLQEIKVKEVEECGSARSQIEAFIRKKSNCNVAIDLLIFLRQYLPKHLGAIKAFNGLAILACNTIKDASVLKHLWNYAIIIYNSRDLWEHLLPLIPLIALKKCPPEDNVPIYRTFTKYLSFVFWELREKESANSTDGGIFLKNFSILMKHYVLNKSTGDFMETVQEILSRKFHIQSLIKHDKQAGLQFLNELLDILQSFAKIPIEDKVLLDKLFLMITDLLELFLEFELCHEIKDHGLSMKLVDIWRTIDTLPEVERYCLSVLKHLCIVFSKRNSNDVENACKKYQNYCENLEQHITENAVVDTFATISLILQKHSEQLQDELSASACVTMIRSISSQIRISSESRKYFCSSCKNDQSKKHCIVTLILVALNFLKGATSKSQTVSTIAFEGALSFIKHHFYILRKLNCTEKMRLIHLSFSRIYNICMRVKQKNAQQYILKIVKYLSEVVCQFDMEEKYRQYIVDALILIFTNQSDMRQILNVKTLNLLLQIKSQNLSLEQISEKIEKDLLYHLFELRSYIATNLIDIIENDSFEWYGSKVEFDPCQLLLGQMISYENVHSMQLYLCTMKKLVTLTSDPRILCPAFIQLPSSLYVNFSNELEILLKNTQAHVEYPEKNFHLAVLYYVNCMKKIMARKQTLNKVTINERSINDLKWSFLENFSIDEEKNILLMAKDAVKSFEQCEKKICLMHGKSLLKIWTKLAEELKTLGLIRESLRIYDLMYEISTKLNDEESILRAMSNIFFFSNMYEEIKCNKAIVNEIASSQTGLMAGKLSTVHEGDEAHQSLIISCLLNYAVFCAEAGGMEYAVAYLRVVQSTIQSLDKNTHLEILFVCTEYLIMIKYGEKCHRPYIGFMDHIIKSFKSFNQNHTAVHLILEIVRELVEFSVLRNDSDGIIHYIILMLKYYSKSGYIFQVAQILLLYAKVDLVEEKVSNFRAKLYYLLEFLDLKCSSEGEGCLQVLEKQISETSGKVQTKWSDILAIRKLVSDHSQKCTCFMCLSSQGEDISQQINLFLVWMLCFEGQYNEALEASTEIFIKKEDTNVTPYMIKSKYLLTAAHLKRGNTEMTILECESNKESYKKVKTHRIALQQTVEAQMILLNHIKNNDGFKIPQKPVPDNEIVPATPPTSPEKRRDRRRAIVNQANFQILLDKAATESASAEKGARGGKTSIESELDAKFGARVNNTETEEVEKETVKKAKKNPQNTKKRSTRNTKKK